jgi:hypothetical protein
MTSYVHDPNNWKFIHSQTTTGNEGNSCGYSTRDNDPDQRALLISNAKQKK